MPTTSKVINAGAMRNRVSFYRDSGSGTPGAPINATNNPEFWCSFRTLKGEVKYHAQRVWQKTTSEITMRYTKVFNGTNYEEVSIGWFALVDKREWHRIELVINENQRNEVLTLTVSYAGPYQDGGGDIPPDP